jgi:hypothetical protein
MLTSDNAVHIKTSDFGAGSAWFAPPTGPVEGRTLPTSRLRDEKATGDRTPWADHHILYGDGGNATGHNAVAFKSAQIDEFPWQSSLLYVNLIIDL